MAELEALLNEAGQTAEGIIAAGESLLQKFDGIAEPEIASEVATIRRFIDAFKVAADGVTSDGSGAAAQIAEIQAALADKTSALEAASARIVELEKEVTDVQTQLTSAQDEVATLREAAAAHPAEAALLLHNDAPATEAADGLAEPGDQA